MKITQVQRKLGQLKSIKTKAWIKAVTQHGLASMEAKALFEALTEIDYTLKRERTK